ncbi:MAG: hypothetical protein ACPG4T_03430 [Nannocystaceae bacterium]
MGTAGRYKSSAARQGPSGPPTWSKKGAPKGPRDGPNYNGEVEEDSDTHALGPGASVPTAIKRPSRTSGFASGVTCLGYTCPRISTPRSDLDYGHTTIAIGAAGRWAQ